MGLLDWIKNAHRGSWGTPDFQLSERVSDLFGQSRDQSGGSSLFDLVGNVYARDVINNPENQNVPQLIRGSVLGDDNTNNNIFTGGSGGFNPTQNTGDTLPDQQIDQAEDARQNQLNAILARLGIMREQANRLRGSATDVRDQILQDVGSRYGNLKTAVQGRVGTALENLGQEDVGIQNTYGRAAGNTRRAMESALRKNRVMARAMGRLNSSFYDDRQAETTRGGATAISDLGAEEAGKRAAIKTRQTETKNWGKQQLADLDREQASLENQAWNEYKNAIAAADELEKITGIDTYEAAAEAEQTFQSRLNKIQSYINDKALKMMEISASTAPYSSAINNFQAINPALAEKLANARAQTRASNFISNIPTFGSIQAGSSVDPNVLLGFGLDKEQGLAYDDILRRLGLLRS